MKVPFTDSLTLLSPLWGLVVLAVLGALVIFMVSRRSKRPETTARLSTQHQLARVKKTVTKDHPNRWRKAAVSAIPVLLVSGLVFLSFGAAQPAMATQTAKEQSLMCLILDNSLSMEYDDIDPTRIDAMKQAARKAIEKSPDDLQVVVVTFAGETDIVIEPTLNKGEALKRIDGIQLAGGGTAMGEGIFTALDVLESMEDSPLRTAEEMSEGDEAPVACIALSDGASLEGRTPREAAEKAATLGVPVYTVAFADPGTEAAFYKPDIPALQEVADVTHADFKQAVSSDELEEIFDSITAKAATETDFQGVGHIPTVVGALLLALGSLISVRFYGRTVI